MRVDAEAPVPRRAQVRVVSNGEVIHDLAAPPQ
jgi:hypothetical protein